MFSFCLYVIPLCLPLVCLAYFGSSFVALCRLFCICAYSMSLCSIGHRLIDLSHAAGLAILTSLTQGLRSVDMFSYATIYYVDNVNCILHIISVQVNSACLKSTATPFSFLAVPQIRLLIKGQPTMHCSVYTERLSYLTQMLQTERHQLQHSTWQDVRAQWDSGMHTLGLTIQQDANTHM